MGNRLFHTIEEAQCQEKSIEDVKNEVYELWQECFHDSDSYTDFYMQWKVKDNRILTIYKNGQLSSMLHLNPYILMVKGKPVPANYIVGVATRKRERRQGFMKALLESALNQMCQQHMPFTYLMPVAEAIYEPFGFQTIYTQLPWHQTYEQAGRRVHSLSLDLDIMFLDKYDYKRMEELSVYTNCLLSKQYDIYTHRTAYYYERLVHEVESTGGNILLCYKNQELAGYLSYMADGGIYITEYLTELDDESFLSAMHEYISENDTGLRIAQVAEEEPEPPKIMVRIVDLASFARLLSSEVEQKLVIKVRDSILTDNNDTFELQFKLQECIITRTKEEPEISADIDDLTALFFGTLSEEEITALICNKAKEAVKNKLDHVVKLGNVFINDVV